MHSGYDYVIVNENICTYHSNDVMMTSYPGLVDVSVEECSKLIGQYEATDQGKVEGLMSIDGE